MKNIQPIQLEDIKLPKDVKFEKTTDGFKINSTGGEFFPNKWGGPILFFSLIIFFGIFAFGGKYLSIFFEKYLKNFFWQAAHSSGSAMFLIILIYIIVLAIPIYLRTVIPILTNIDTEYIFSPSGINISSKKGSLFISKDNISNIYYEAEKVEVRRSSFIKYCVYLDFKTRVYIPDTRKYLDKVNLFYDSIFQNEDIAFFFVQEIKKTFEMDFE